MILMFDEKLYIWRCALVFLEIYRISSYHLNSLRYLSVKLKGVRGLASNRLGLEVKGGYLAARALFWSLVL